MQTCKQCGCTKAPTHFRKYYNGSNNRYNTCYDCEQINSRRKYLERKKIRTDTDEQELSTIYELYEELAKKGLKPPRRGGSSVTQYIKKTLENLKTADSDLFDWLTKDLSGYTVEELENVYDDLTQRYRPTLGIGPDLLPIYDDTHRNTLLQILKRFDEYEDAQYEEEE